LHFPTKSFIAPTADLSAFCGFHDIPPILRIRIIGPNTHQPKLSYSVTLSEAKGLDGHRDASLQLSMTVLSSCHAIAI